MTERLAPIEGQRKRPKPVKLAPVEGYEPPEAVELAPIEG